MSSTLTFRAGLQTILIAALLAAGTLTVTDTQASDRDTPAYRIYVDPVTGRYSTKPPEDKTASTASVSSMQAAPVTASNTSPGNGANTRRPLTAALLLVAIATASLLARKRQSY